MKTTIVAPVITEKSYKDAQKGIYTFVVDNESNKHEIKNAVEEMFKVNVVDVHTIVIPGKRLRFGRNKRLGRRSDQKKALVTLKSGEKIGVFEV